MIKVNKSTIHPNLNTLENSLEGLPKHINKDLTITGVKFHISKTMKGYDAIGLQCEICPNKPLFLSIKKLYDHCKDHYKSNAKNSLQLLKNASLSQDFERTQVCRRIKYNRTSTKLKSMKNSYFDMKSKLAQTLCHNAQINNIITKLSNFDELQSIFQIPPYIYFQVFYENSGHKLWSNFIYQFNDKMIKNLISSLMNNLTETTIESIGSTLDSSLRFQNKGIFVNNKKIIKRELNTDIIRMSSNHQDNAIAGKCNASLKIKRSISLPALLYHKKADSALQIDVITKKYCQGAHNLNSEMKFNKQAETSTEKQKKVITKKINYEKLDYHLYMKDGCKPINCHASNNYTLSQASDRQSIIPVHLDALICLKLFLYFMEIEGLLGTFKKNINPPTLSSHKRLNNKQGNRKKCELLILKNIYGLDHTVRTNIVQDRPLCSVKDKINLRVKKRKYIAKNSYDNEKTIINKNNKLIPNSRESVGDLECDTTCTKDQKPNEALINRRKTKFVKLLECDSQFVPTTDCSRSKCKDLQLPNVLQGNLCFNRDANNNLLLNDCTSLNTNCVKFSHLKAKNHTNYKNPDLHTFKCSFCNYWSRTSSQLKVHMKRHQGIRGYTCKVCDYHGVTQSDLNRHKKAQSHLCRAQNVCSNCDKGFMTKYILDQHKCETESYKQEKGSPKSKLELIFQKCTKTANST